MTNKIREKFFYTFFTSIISMTVILAIPLLTGDSQITSWYYQKIHLLLYSHVYEGMFVLSIIGIILFFLAHKNKKVKETQKKELIHDAFNYQELLLVKQKEQEKLISETKNAIKQYIRLTICPYIQEIEYTKLIENIYNWDESNGLALLPIITDGRLSSLDLRHLAWNIGRRLGWNGNKCATFIKICFPIELKELEIETIRRNLRQKGTCRIDIDIPEPGDYRFHL